MYDILTGRSVVECVPCLAGDGEFGHRITNSNREQITKLVKFHYHGMGVFKT